MQKACEKNAASQRVTIHEIEDQLNRSEKNNFVEDERFHLIACTSNCKNERDQEMGGRGWMDWQKVHRNSGTVG